MTNQVIYVFWVSQLVLKALLVVLLLARGMRRAFPIFTAFSIFNFLSGVVAFATFGNRTVYLYVYLVNESVSVLFGLAIVYEIFHHLFAAQPALRRLASNLFGVAVVAIALLSTFLIYIYTPTLRGFGSTLLAANTTARGLEVALLLFVFICSGTFGLHWRQHVFGISLGQGLFIAIQLAVLSLAKYATGPASAAAVRFATLVAFDVCALIWIGYLFAPEKATSEVLPDRSQLEQWNRAVMELIHQ